MFQRRERVVVHLQFFLVDLLLREVVQLLFYIGESSSNGFDIYYPSLLMPAGYLLSPQLSIGAQSRYIHRLQLRFIHQELPSYPHIIYTIGTGSNVHEGMDWIVYWIRLEFDCNDISFFSDFERSNLVCQTQ